MIGVVKMIQRFKKVTTILLFLCILLTGCNTTKKKDEYKIFEFGSTVSVCKKKFENYKVENFENGMMKVHKYTSLNGKDVDLLLNFSGELMIDDTMKFLDDERLILYTFSVKDVDYNFNLIFVDKFIKLYGQPTTNDFSNKDAKDMYSRTAVWKMEDCDISIYDHIGKDSSFISLSFKPNDKIREKFKQYIK